MTTPAKIVLIGAVLLLVFWIGLNFIFPTCTVIEGWVGETQSCNCKGVEVWMSRDARLDGTSVSKCIGYPTETIISEVEIMQ